MDIIVGIIWDFAWWIIGIGVALCMVVVLFGILKYSMAQGDPQKAAGARATMFGGAFGVVALPVALIAFRIFFGDVIAPNTGVDAGFLEQNCDRILQAQLQARPSVVTKPQAVGLIGAIQRDKSECAKENWMGTATAALKVPASANTNCGLTTASALVKRAVTSAKSTNGAGYARTGGAIVISFDTAAAQAAHLVGDVDACWVFDPSAGQWHLGSNE